MSTLIRSSRFGKEPLILELPRSRIEVELQPEIGTRAVLANPEPPFSPFQDERARRGSSEVDAEPFETAAMSQTEFAADTGYPPGLAERHPASSVGAQSDTTPAPSYAEYKERFQQELEALKELAVQDGYREGQDRARREQELLEAGYVEKLQELAEVIASARAAVNAGIESLHEIGAEVVYEAVLKILGSNLISHDGIQAVVREVIKRARDTTRLVVRVAPENLEGLKNKRSALLENLDVGTVDIVADERVQLGGCLLETPAGNLDGRLEVQLQCLREVLLAARVRRLDGGALA